MPFPSIRLYRAGGRLPVGKPSIRSADLVFMVIGLADRITGASHPNV